MGKTKKAAGSPRRSSSGESSERSLAAMLHVMLGVILLSSIVIAFRVCKIYVDRELAAPIRPPRVVLVNRPAWMSDFLAEEIVKSARPTALHSAFDRQLLVDTAARLDANPWVRDVKQVRRVYDQSPGDTLEIDCDYRAPVALVPWGNYYWLVDADGVILPEQYSSDELSRIMLGPDGRINIRLIEGVARPPGPSGRIWPGDDLAGGLELAKLIADEPWADEIRVIDVSNFNQRRDVRSAQIVLCTTFGTQVRWGRPPGAKDAFIEVPAATKLATLETIYQQKKRVDADEPWIDVRFDRVTCPAATPVASASPAEARSIDGASQ